MPHASRWGGVAPAEALLSDPLVVLLALAFGPPLLYLAGLTWSGRGRGGAALVGFLYGATLSIVVLGGLYVLLTMAVGNPVRTFQEFFTGQGIGAARQKDFVLVVVLAPLVEEAAKGLGVWLLGGRVNGPREAAFLGAAVGLGFAAIETLMYLLAAFADGGSQLAGATLFTVLVVAGLRSVSSALLHPSATALTGYGLGRAWARGRSAFAALPFYALAVGLHGAYNYLAAFLPPQQVGGWALEVNLLAAMLLASLAWGFVKRGVRA
jgi:protease PrsW